MDSSRPASGRSISAPAMTLAAVAVTAILLLACSKSPSATPTPTPTNAVAAAQTRAAVAAALANAESTRAAATRTGEAARFSPTVIPPTATSPLRPIPTPRPTAIRPPVPTPTPPVAGRVTSDTLNVRGGPGTNYPRLGELRQGDRFTVLECNAGRDWLRVRSDGGLDGWVSASLTDVGVNAARAPVARFIPTPPIVVAAPGMIAFKSDRGGILIMNADGSSQQPLADPSIYYYALRHSGPEYCARSGLYCVKADDAGDRSGNMDIWVEDREYHNGWRKIVSNYHLDWDPRIHPDGWWVIFVTNRNGNDELFLISRQAREERRLTVNDWEWDKHPTWSPDGRLIAFFSNRVTGRRQIWVLDPWSPLVENVNPRNVSNNPYVDYEPVWLK